MLHSWLLRSELLVNVELICPSIVATEAGNLVQHALQTRIVFTMGEVMQIFYVCIDQNRMISITRQKISYSTIDNLALVWLSI